MQRMVAAVVCGSVAIAHGQPAHTEADRLFDEGRERAHAGDYAAACEKFTRSYELDPALGTELNLADCDEHIGHLRAAWELYLAAAMQAERAGEPKRADFARQHADAVAAHLATLVLDVAEPNTPGLAIEIGGRTFAPQREIRDRVEPGEIEVVATAPGKPRFATKVHAVAGQTVLVALPVPGEAPPLPRGAPPPNVEPVASGRSGRVHLAWGLAATAGASAIAALAFGAVARDDYNTAAGSIHCDRANGVLECDGAGASSIHHAQTLADFGTGFAASAIVLGAASAYLYFTAPRDAGLAPVATRSTLGVAWTGRF